MVLQAHRGRCFAIWCKEKAAKPLMKPKRFVISNLNLRTQLLQMITDTTIAYLDEQIKAGADTVQIFDSWGGLLSPQDFEVFSLPYIHTNCKCGKTKSTRYHFCKRCLAFIRKNGGNGRTRFGH